MAQIGVQRGDRHHGTGMRRHQRVHDGQARKHRQSRQQIGIAFQPAGILRQLRADIQYDGHHQNHAGFKEQRQSQDHGHRAHGPRHHARPADVQQAGRHAIGAAGAGKHFTEHRAQRQKHADIGQGVAKAFAEAAEYLGGGRTGPKPKYQRTDYQRRERVEPEARDGDDHRQDNGDGNTHQCQIVRRHESPRTLDSARSSQSDAAR